MFETGIEKLVLFSFIILSVLIAGAHFGVFDKLSNAISKDPASSKVDIGKSNYPDFIMEFKHSIVRNLNPSFTAKAWFSSPPYGWTKIDYDDSAWQEVQVNNDFWNGCDNCDVFVRKEVDVPAESEDITEGKIYVCANDNLELYVNEMHVGNYGSGCRWIDIKKFLKKGKNVIAMHCHDNSGSDEQCRITSFSIKYKEHKLKVMVNPKKAIVSPEGTPFIDYIIKIENLEDTPKVLKVYLTKPIQIITDDPKFVISVVDIDDNTTKVVLYLNPRETKEFKFRYLNPYKALDLNVLKLPIKIEDERGNVIYNDSLELYSSSNVVKYYQILDKNPNVGIVSNKKLEIIKGDTFINKLLNELPKKWETLNSGQVAYWSFRRSGCCGWEDRDFSKEIQINKYVKTVKIWLHSWVGDCSEARVRWTKIDIYGKNNQLIKSYQPHGDICSWGGTDVTVDLGGWKYVTKIVLRARLSSEDYDSDDTAYVEWRNLRIYSADTMNVIEGPASVKVQCDNNIYSAKLTDNGDIVEVDFNDIPCVNFVEDTYKPYTLIINEQPKTIWIYTDNDKSNALLWEKWEALKQEVSGG